MKRVALIIAGVVVAQTVQAFVDPPVLVPSNPSVGQIVSASITAGGCDAFTDYPPPVISRVGDAIRIVIQSASEPAGPFCIIPAGTSYFPVGAFDAGSYSLQVDRTYLGFNGLVTETLGTLGFVVTPIASIPAFGLWGKVAFCLALVVAVYTSRCHNWLRWRRAG